MLVHDDFGDAQIGVFSAGVGFQDLNGQGADGGGWISHGGVVKPLKKQDVSKLAARVEFTFYDILGEQLCVGLPVE